MVALAKQDNRIIETFPIDTVIQGDCLEVLSTLADNSIDALCCDPPAGIEFMGKDWDSNKGSRHAWIAWLCSVMQECYRVMKPGAHGLVWALPRTSHWTATALEDAGFEIRDVITHIQGQGFPKSKNLGNGVGSALKPSSEHWILVRKPLSERSLEANYARWGVGGLNIDASRVGTQAYTQEQWTQKGLSRVTGNSYGVHKASDTPVPSGRFPSNLLLSHSLFCVPLGEKRVKGTAPHGRPTLGQSQPANVTWGLSKRSDVQYADEDGLETIQAYDCHPSCPVAELDRQSGIRPAGYRKNPSTHGNAFFGNGRESHIAGERGYPDQGGASRYFQTFYYCPKSSRSERNKGCEGLPEQYAARVSGIGGDKVSRCPVHDTSYVSGAVQYTCGCPHVYEGGTYNRVNAMQNNHPTVKSIQLMRYLVKLVTPPNGTVLDCFAGSGSTCIAAIHEGFHFIGVEQSAEYVSIARARVSHAIREVR